VNKGHIDFPLDAPELTHRFFDLGVFALVTFFLEPLIDAFGCVTLLFGKAFIAADDLGDALKKGANLWLGSRGADPRAAPDTVISSLRSPNESVPDEVSHVCCNLPVIPLIVSLSTIASLCTPFPSSKIVNYLKIRLSLGEC